MEPIADQAPPKKSGEEITITHELGVLILSLYAIAAVGADFLLEISPEVSRLIAHIDLAVCGFFFWDFLRRLSRAPSKSRYMATWGWIDLLSSIPMIEALRFARFTRIIRILRILRAFRSSSELLRLAFKNRLQGAAESAILVGVLIIVFASFAILNVENVPEGNIRTAEDAIWWTWATITTVGYGDRYPVTTEGRLIAMLVMIAGAGIFGTITAAAAAGFAKSADAAEDNKVAAELRLLRSELAALREQKGNTQEKQQQP